MTSASQEANRARKEENVHLLLLLT